MADKMKVEAGNQLLAALTAEEIARMTSRNINKVLEEFMQSDVAELIFDLKSDYRFLGPATLAKEYIGIL